MFKPSLTIYTNLKLIFEYTSHQKVVLLQPFTPNSKFILFLSFCLKIFAVSLYLVLFHQKHQKWVWVWYIVEENFYIITHFWNMIGDGLGMDEILILYFLIKYKCSQLKRWPETSLTQLTFHAIGKPYFI